MDSSRMYLAVREEEGGGRRGGGGGGGNVSSITEGQNNYFPKNLPGIK